jgi:hypothetical protein
MEQFRNEDNNLELHKKQNVFLSNELINLKVKLNKIKNQNDLLKSLLHDQVRINNPKVLEKFINNFIERLAINWNEVCDSLIDDLLEQEVYNLNEIELEKINYNEIRLTTFTDVLRNAPSVPNNNVDLMFESLFEIQRMINQIKYTENLIENKYHINEN